MAQWSRAWGRRSSGGCLTSCYNPLYPPASTEGNVLDGFPLSIQTCGQAVEEFSQALKSALPANSIIVKTNSDSSFTLDIRINSKITAIVAIRFKNTSCDFPITATYTKGSHTGTASFSGLPQLLNWLVSVLR